MKLRILVALGVVALASCDSPPPKTPPPADPPPDPVEAPAAPTTSPEPATSASSAPVDEGPPEPGQ